MMNEKLPVAQQGGEVLTGVVVGVGDVGVDAVYQEPETKIDLEARIARMVHELKIPTEYVTDLLKLVGTDIVVIADDSGSMNSITDPNNSAKPMTRWQELQNTLRLLVTMLLVVEHDEGFWLKFLNDDGWCKVTTPEQLDTIFANKPRASGRTPLKRNLMPVMHGYGCEENDTLVLLLTDGEPTDCTFDELGALIRGKSSDVFLSVAMCTDEDHIVELYNTVIDPIPGCDITDDFISEKREALQFGNMMTPYSWLAKMLLVKFDKYDKLDEQRMGGPQKGVNQQCGCTIS